MLASGTFSTAASNALVLGTSGGGKDSITVDASDLRDRADRRREVQGLLYLLETSPLDNSYTS